MVSLWTQASSGSHWRPDPALHTHETVLLATNSCNMRNGRIGKSMHAACCNLFVKFVVTWSLSSTCFWFCQGSRVEWALPRKDSLFTAEDCLICAVSSWISCCFDLFCKPVLSEFYPRLKLVFQGNWLVLVRVNVRFNMVQWQSQRPQRRKTHWNHSFWLAQKISEKVRQFFLRERCPSPCFAPAAKCEFYAGECMILQCIACSVLWYLCHPLPVLYSCWLGCLWPLSGPALIQAPWFLHLAHLSAASCMIVGRCSTMCVVMEPLRNVSWTPLFAVSWYNFADAAWSMWH